MARFVPAAWCRWPEMDALHGGGAAGDLAVRLPDATRHPAPVPEGRHDRRVPRAGGICGV